MFDFPGFFGSANAKLKREHHYRVFRELRREPGRFPQVQWRAADGAWRDATVWCSNDYLGMSQHPIVLEAAHDALARYGAGAGGTRNISGTTDLLVALERELADWHAKDAALLFSSGYVANDTTLATLARALPGVIVFSDAANHSSMIQGIRASRQRCVVFRHNDPAHLDALLAAHDSSTPKLVVFESLYSMDGDIAPLAALLAVAKRHGALTFVDETHAVGVHGPRGSGLLEAHGLLDAVDIVQGGLGKGVGVVGGFITGDAAVIDFVRSHAPGFIFTTALPPHVAAAALASVRHLKESGAERAALRRRVASTRTALAAARIPIASTPSQILPLIIGDAGECRALADRLLERHGIYLQAIVHPTVPRDAARLRITPGPLHTDADEARLVAALVEARAACASAVAAGSGSATVPGSATAHAA
ncbi:MAG: 5-aminolevulinate synthase [Steroidobacteraceae bacterium]|nr:5-aminolevulinate synthase [Steroidobacteraceae bacterium]